jgi:hypothetical protein
MKAKNTHTMSTNSNSNSTVKTVARKKRTDRNHIIYELRVNGGNYIGVTAKTESTVLKSVRARAAKHFYRAKKENKNWSLCIALRELTSKDEIEILVHEIVRGKAEAHKREVQLRRQINPTLNTDVRGDALTA